MVIEEHRDSGPDGAKRPTRAEVMAMLQIARPGLRFSEVMTGLITLGSHDPVAGYRDEAAIGVILRATVQIANLPAFLKDPSHRGNWTAAGSIPVLGGVVRGIGPGDFRLFQRAIRGNKGVREMVYDAKIAVGNQRYEVRGRKEIEPAPPWRGWPATTTLHVRLCDPEDGGRVVAAGILRISPWGFVRQLASMRITGNFSRYDKLLQRIAFYRFFVSALARTYLMGRRW